MKNFLKLTAIFACLALAFVACTEDDTVDGYVPNFPAIDAETVTVTRGDGKIKVVWTVPEEESITYSKISWSGADNGSEILSVVYGAETTFIIGVDDEAGEKGTPLSAGEYTIKIESMEGKYVGTGSWASTESYVVYNQETYEGKYPVTTSIVHDNSDATITWGSFPDDCISVDINYTNGEDEAVVLIVVPSEALEATTTLLEDAKIDSKVTFTPSFCPEGAIEEDIIVIAKGGETEITISDEVKSIPKIQSALGGNMRLYVEWTVYQDLDISSSTVTLVNSSNEEFELYTIDYNNFDSESTIYGYTEETKDNTEVKSVYMYIDEDMLSGSPYTFAPGAYYTIKVVNTVEEASVPATTEALYVYDSTTYAEAPTTKEVTHNGVDAVIEWDLSAMTGYGADDVNSSYNALYKIDVTYKAKVVSETSVVTYEEKTMTFTSEDTNHFSFECNLSDAAYDIADASFTYKAYFRPEGAIELDEEFVVVSVETAVEIPYPDLASPVGVELRTGYNDDVDGDADSSYIEVKWFDVDGALGSVNDAIVDVLVFYTNTFADLDALATSIKTNSLTGQVGTVYTDAAWSTSIGWKGATPVSAVNFLETTSADFIKNETVVNGATITIGKTDDKSGVTAGLVADKQYFIAVASINAAGQLNFSNLNSNYYTSLDAVASEWSLDLDTIDYDNYIQRTITTYNKATYTSEEGNATVFADANTITRSRTSAIIAWNWTTATKSDVVAVKVTEYTNNVGEIVEPTTETSSGNSTTLTNVKAGEGKISGYTAYFCPSALSGEVCGIERVEIEQTLKLDIPYLTVPTHTMSMMVGVNDGNTTNATTDSGEPYIKVSWVLEDSDANVDNISGYKVMYRTGEGDYVEYEADLAANAREVTIAPSTPLTADVDYDVYVAYVDLDGYTRPLKENTDDKDGSEDAAKIKTYNKLSYSDIALPLDGSTEELAYDGESMTLYWGTVPTDCIGVVITMTSGTRAGQTYGYEYVLGASTVVDDVTFADEFTYTPYFRPADVGEVIVAGKTSTQDTDLVDLSVPVNSAPTRADITNITSTYVYSAGEYTPQVTLEWDFSDAELNRNNIATEGGNKYMYIYCYEDGATNYSFVEDMIITDDTHYSYEIPSSSISTDKSYTIYISTKNTVGVYYNSDVYTGVRTYTPSLYDSSMIPSISSASTNTNNEIEVSWYTDNLSEDLREIYIIYNSETSEDSFYPSSGVGTVPYVSGVSKVSIMANFKPTYVEEADEDDPDYVEPEQVVFYGEPVSFTSTQVTAQTYEYDIAYNDGIYTIFTAKGLAAFADLVNGTSVYTSIVQTNGTITSWDQADGLIAEVKLLKDIDLSDLDSGTERTSWTPIADYSTSTTNVFSGIFDGGGYTIDNLYINVASGYQGLFGNISGAKISNIILDNVSVTATSTSENAVAALVGYANGAATIDNCIVKSGSVSSTYQQGTAGILGDCSSATVSNSTNGADVTCTSHHVGGLVGRFATLTVTDCVNTGNVISTGGGYSGALIGGSTAATTITVTGSKNSGSLTVANHSGNSHAGGIVGYLYVNSATITNCENSGVISGTGNLIGGVIGCARNNTATASNITISGCTNSGTVQTTNTARTEIGGILGGSNVTNPFIVTTSNNTGSVTGGSSVGGIVGCTYSGCEISGESLSSPNTNSGTISGISYVGGIVGTLAEGATLQYYDNYGEVSGTGSDIGGIVGSNSGTVIDCVDKTDPANSAATEDDIKLVSDVWEIYTFKGLVAFADIVNGTSYFYTADQNVKANAVVKGNLDYSDMSDTYSWYPMALYEGTFDGGNDAGFTISNFTISATSDYQGLFASTVGATIKNVSMESVAIESSASYVGAIAGYATSGTTISNCKILSGSVTSTGTTATTGSNSYYTGAIVGYNYGGDGAKGSVVENCTNDAKVTGVAYVGGIAGYNYPGSSTTACEINSCENSGKVYASGNWVGGIVGYNLAPEDSSKDNFVAIVYNCKNSGLLELTSSYVGGLVGYNTYAGAKVYGYGESEEPTTYQSYNTAAVYGSSYVGGIVGANYNGATISFVRNDGEVKATGSYIGGILGVHDDASYIDHCWNASTGNVYGVGTDQYVGGVSGAGEIGNYTENVNKASIYTNASSDPDIQLDGDVYKIWSAEGLIAFANLVNGTTNTSEAVLSGFEESEFGSTHLSISGEIIKDIDFEDVLYTYVTIGTSTNAYTGAFDGGSYTISNLSITATSTNQGLFGSVTSGTVKNVKLKNFSLSTTGNIAGAIAGAATTATITNCEVISGTISGASNLGGIVGVNYYSDIENCTNSASVSGKGYTGGIAGNYGANTATSGVTKKSGIRYCVNNGEITSTAVYPAGIVGYYYPNGSLDYGCEILGCTNNGDVTCVVGGAAGFVGYVRTSAAGFAAITDCTNNGNIEGSGNNIGGCLAYGTCAKTAVGIVISGFVNNGDVTNNSGTNTGGVVGSAENGYSITSSNNFGDITGQGNNVGGIIGSKGTNDAALGTVSYCNNEGDVTGPSNVGGIAGSGAAVTTGDSTTPNYNKGTVSGTSNVGGLVGSNGGALSYYNNYGQVLVGGVDSTESYGLIGTGTTPTDCNNYYEPSEEELEPETFEISNEEELLAFATAAAADPSVSGTLTASFSLETAWTPIANYTGTFDGAGYTITGMTISAAAANQGLFATTTGATIKDLNLAGVSVTSSAGYAGAIVGTATAATTISNCTAAGSVSGTTYLGGIAGYNVNSTIEYSSSSVTVSGSGNLVGGIAGYNHGENGTISVIDNCTNSGSVTGEGTCSGGIAGRNHLTGTISNSTNTGVVKGTSYTGGIVGHNCPNGDYPDTYVTSCTNNGSVSGTNKVGGVVGQNQENVSKPAYVQYSSNYGDVDGTGENIGGIVGENTGTSVITGSSSVNYGAVTGTSDATTVGGIVGAANSGVISGYTNYGLVTINGTASNSANGIYGTTSSQDTITDCYDAYVDLEATDLDIKLVGSTYSIYTAAGLVAFADIVNGTLTSVDGLNTDNTVTASTSNTGANATLQKDIDLTSVASWTPIADRATTATLAYTGTFDGNGKTISKLTISTTDSYQGLFGYTSAATISDVTMVAPVISAAAYAGAIAGAAVAATTITNCSVELESEKGSITTSGNYAGSVVGYNSGSTVAYCSNEVAVDGASYVGGIAGSSTGSAALVVACANGGTVKASAAYMGGVVGYNVDSSQVVGCYNTGALTQTSKNCNGGIVGRNAGYIVGCYDAGSLTSDGIYNGRVAGRQDLAAVGTVTVVDVANTTYELYSTDYIKGNYYVEIDGDSIYGVGSYSDKLKYTSDDLISTDAVQIVETKDVLNSAEYVNAMNTAIAIYNSDYKYEVGTSDNTMPVLVKK